MNQKQKTEHFKNKAEQFRTAYFKLMSETNRLKNTLRDISVGLASETTKNNGWSHQIRLQYDAAEALKKYQHVEEPLGPFYI